MFLRDYWYVAALSADVAREPIQRWILGEPVVLYRRQTGEPVAMRDRCPHRHAPLSLGKLVGDDIQCLYHGFQFDCSGACTLIPGEKTVPPAVRVETFPVAERYGFVWVWTGDPAGAREDLLPDWPWHGKEGFLSHHTDLTFEAPFQMIVDNLMDLTHVHFVHKILGAGNLIHESEPMKVWRDGDCIRYTRDMRKGDGDLYVEIGGAFLPPSLAITSAVPKRDGSDEVQPGPMSKVLHCLTPIDEHRTRYFALKCWNLATKPHEIAAVHHQIAVTLDEDQGVIEAQYRNKRAAPDVPERLIRADRAAVEARRLHGELLEKQERGE